MGHPDAIQTGGAQRLTWGKAEVCNALGVSSRTFDVKRRELERAGFPAKVPGLNLWPIAAVEDWVAHAGGLYVPFAERPETVSATIPDSLLGLSAAIDRRYAGVPT